MPFWNFGKKKQPPTDAVTESVQHHADGSQTVTTSFALKGPGRPVRTEVVTALDDALAELGGHVMHAMDPRRLLGFAEGGPSVWSVGIVDVPGPTPYSLLLTYGFSHTLSPEDCRQGVAHEYSLAVPAGVPLSPWADALLRHQCRYILTQGADIRVNDCVPFRDVPMTRIPFQPEHHAMMPDSTLVGVLATADPVLRTVRTPTGPIEVRRLVGIDAAELDRAETWSPKGFLEELQKVDPLLLSPPVRPSWMANAAFAQRVDARAAEEGSDVDVAVFDVAFEALVDGLVIHLPEGQAGKRLRDALVGRVWFGNPLLAVSPRSLPIAFRPGPALAKLTPRCLELGGTDAGAPARRVLDALESGARSVRL